MALDGKRIALLIAPRGTEDPEFAVPKAALEKVGATVIVLGLETGEAKTVNNDLDPANSYIVGTTVNTTKALDFDGLVLPGGCVGADKLRASEPLIDFVRAFFAAGKPVGAICHAPWILVEADVVGGRTLTSFPTLQTDIRNAGGTWVDREVVVDRQLITSRNPKDLPAFCGELVKMFTADRAAAPKGQAEAK